MKLNTNERLIKTMSLTKNVPDILVRVQINTDFISGIYLNRSAFIASTQKDT